MLVRILAMLPIFAACGTGSGKPQPQTARYSPQVQEHKQPTVKATQVPVLCYHQVRDWKSADSKSSRVYILPVDRFSKQMRMLHDSGYHTILPDDLVSALKEGKELPQRSILITFDDGTEPQYINALPILNSAGFKAVFFIMTITVNRPGYLNAKEITDLAAQGHVIGSTHWITRMLNYIRETIGIKN